MIKKFKSTYTYKVFRTFAIEVVDIIETIGYISIILLGSLKHIIKGNVKLKETVVQSSRFGFDSLPISLALVGLCGMIISLQIAYEMVKQGAGHYVGALVTVSIIREIGPVMASFAVISMVGSAMAAEIGTMKVTEQIDAMKTLKTDPVEYLIVPRIIAGVLIMPFVIILANTVGVLGGMFSSKMTSGLNAVKYIESVWHGLNQTDILVSILKASIFGGLISLICASVGYKTQGGALDVGKATTKAVVWSFVAVIIVDYIISLIFFS